MLYEIVALPILKVKVKANFCFYCHLCACDKVTGFGVKSEYRLETCHYEQY